MSNKGGQTVGGIVSDNLFQVMPHVFHRDDIVILIILHEVVTHLIYGGIDSGICPFSKGIDSGTVEVCGCSIHCFILSIGLLFGLLLRGLSPAG